ncbi:MAG: DUF3598 family protein [Synechococcus sp.]|nr:DUF3598 family protein [Synechococcus sp.]
MTPLSSPPAFTAAPSSAAPSGSERRRWLLAANAGRWQGSFVRLDGEGREAGRFPHDLLVQELPEEPVGTEPALIDACLTNTSAGTSRSMSFREPPAEMQISAEGHWSLGPDRIGAWSWVAELSLVWGDRRRRAVVRLTPERLESLVLVWEARPGREDPAPPAPVVLPAPGRHQHPSGQGYSRWQVEPGLWFEASWQQDGDLTQQVALIWEPEPGCRLELQRRYGPYGLLEPQA